MSRRKIGNKKFVLLVYDITFFEKGLCGLAVKVFANSPGHLRSIPGRVIPKTQKMVLDSSLLNTQHYKVRIKGKVEQSRERSSALPYTLVYYPLKRNLRGTLDYGRLLFAYIYIYIYIYTYIYILL